MTGKQVVILIIGLLIICLILIWFWLQHVIVKYDLDVASTIQATNVMIDKSYFIKLFKL